jgi:hypothetical protein
MTNKATPTWRLALAALLAMVAMMMQPPAADAQLRGPNVPWAMGESRGEDLRISLATFSPGDDIPSWFGHSAVVVEDTRRGVGRLYNYGMFTFDQAMIFRFAMGRLLFWVGDSSIYGTYDFYRRMNRDVRIQELNLSAARRLEVASFLADNVREENREYLYHHYDDNCATRIRDIIDLATGGQFKEMAMAPGRMTLREHTRRHSGHNPPMDALLMFLMNSDIDHPTRIWDEMFLPEELERRVDDFEYVNEAGERVSLVKARQTYHQSDRRPVPDEPFNLWPWALLLSMLVGAGAVALGRWHQRRPSRASRSLFGLYHAGIGLFLGFPGLILGAMALVTEHQVTYWNQNLFWANPLTLLVIPVALMFTLGSQRGQRHLPTLWLLLSGIVAVGILVNLVGFVVPALYQDTSIPAALAVPMILGATLSLNLNRWHQKRAEA